MQKLVLLSCLIALFVIPMRLGRDARSRRGWSRTLKFMLAFNLFYWFLIRFVYPRL